MADRGAALSPNRVPLCLLLALLFLGLCLVMVADSSARRGTRSGMSTANLMANKRPYGRALGCATRWLLHVGEGEEVTLKSLAIL